MTSKEFTIALAAAKRGTSIVYHTGLLMRDRQLSEDVNALGRAAWAAYEDGRVSLVQRKGDISGIPSYITQVR